LLYTQIHYAEEVRKLYRLRHLISRRSRPGVSAQLGFKEYNEQLRRIKNILKKERVLDRRGRFVENEPNTWLAHLPILADRTKTRVLGERVPYEIFLALALDSKATSRELPKMLKVDRHVTGAAIKRLSEAGLLEKKPRGDLIPDARVRDWLLRYVDQAKAYAFATGDIYYLFSAVPAYIGGPRAYFDQNYLPGRPAGPPRMEIVTYPPFQEAWEAIVKDVRYFRDYPKAVTVEPNADPHESVWIDSLPYKRRPSVEGD